MNIILVDDDEIIREGMRKMISDAGRNWHIVAEAGDGELALQRLAEFPDTDLLITDVRMPVMDGIELIAEMKKSYPQVKIIVLSGFDDFEYVRQAFMNGAVDYLLKPFQKQEFLARMEKLEEEVVKDDELQQHTQKNKTILIANVLQRIFEEEKEEIDPELKELADLGVNTKLPYFAVLSVCVDQYYNPLANKALHKTKLQEKMNGIVKSLSQQREYEYCVYIKNKMLVLLVFCEQVQQLEMMADKVFEEICCEPDERNAATLGISHIHRERRELSAAYDEAIQAVSARFYLGQKRQIRYQDIMGKYTQLSCPLNPIVDQMVHFLELCDGINARKVLEQFFADMSHSRPDSLKKYVISMIEMLLMRVSDFSNALLANGLEYEEQIEEINTCRELQSYMNAMLRGTIEYMEKERSKRAKKKIELAKTFLDQNYVRQITLNDAADQVELNPSYFSNLFKLETGMNFTDYLCDIRMKKAKELLKDPKIKVYEIGNMVGYEDAVSFGRVFKKKIGMSPKEYRNTVY